MSTLKVNKLRDTAGSADAITLDPNGGAVLAGVTTISTARITTGITTSIQVGGGVTISESGIEATGVGITCANINGGQIGGRRNLIINGAMNVSQRETSTTNINTTAKYTVDRFFVQNVTGTAVQTASQENDAPADLYNSLKVTCTTADTDYSTNNQSKIEYRIEGLDLAHVQLGTSNAQTLSVSFYVKSNKTGNTAIGLLNQNNDRSFVHQYTIASANTWQRVSFKVVGDTTGTWNKDTSVGMRMRWGTFGTDYQTGTFDAWQAGQKMATSNSPINFNSATSDYIQVTGVQVELGSQVTPFEHRSFGEELDLCRRYCQVYKSVGNYTRFGTTISQSTSSIRTIFYLKKQLRAVPTYSYSGSFQCPGATNFDMANMALESSSTSTDIIVIKQGSMSVNANNAFFLAGNDDTSAKITFDSEL